MIEDGNNIGKGKTLDYFLFGKKGPKHEYTSVSNIHGFCPWVKGLGVGSGLGVTNRIFPRLCYEVFFVDGGFRIYPF